MRILIVSRLYPPSESIGAFRPYCFARYLAADGHEVSCVAEGESDRDYADEGVNVSSVSVRSAGKIRKKRATKAAAALSSSMSVGTVERSSGNKGGEGILRSARKTLSRFLFLFDEIEWAHYAAKRASEIIEEKEIQYLITSYGPLSSVLAGLKIKKRFPKIKWISDMRDPMDSVFQTGIVRWVCCRAQKKMARAAGAVTTVSNALTEKYIKLPPLV